MNKNISKSYENKSWRTGAKRILDQERIAVFSSETSRERNALEQNVGNPQPTWATTIFGEVLYFGLICKMIVHDLSDARSSHD